MRHRRGRVSNSSDEVDVRHSRILLAVERPTRETERMLIIVLLSISFASHIRNRNADFPTQRIDAGHTVFAQESDQSARPIREFRVGS